MIDKLKLKVSSVVIRYVAIGIGAYAIELSFLLFLHDVIGYSSALSVAIAFWVGFVASFLLQKLFTFRDFKRTLQVISKQAGAYSLLVGFNYIFTLIVVSLFPSHLVVLSRTLALMVTTVWNYVIYKRIFTPYSAQEDLRPRGHRYINNFSSKRLLFGLLLCVPIILFFFQYVASGNKFILGDFDYYSQMYEAFRVSVLHFHQFPLWNPWMSGGVPLFANPQFGLVSLQSALVLPFGAIFGLKLTYVIYALAGFWGMYVLLRKVISASPVRSILISYIWVFSGFFAGHNISHFTTISFFLLPWLIYLMVERQKKYSWLWFGLLMSVIVWNAIDFVLLTVLFVLAGLSFLYALPFTVQKLRLRYKWRVAKSDLGFILKAFLVALILGGYRFVVAYMYAASNPRPAALLYETKPGLGVIIKALFLPIGSLMKIPAHLQWGWAEYSMYMGMGASLAFFICLMLLITKLIRRKRTGLKLLTPFVWAVIVVGIVGFLLAIGDFGKFSPYHLLKLLPGYSQTRVSSRWLFLSSFAILAFLAAWKTNKKFINVLLALAAIELFFTYGPPRIDGSYQVKLPPSHFANTFSEYDNGRNYLDVSSNPMSSFYYATSNNKGQVYSDESFVDTLDKVVGTDKCGINVDPACTFVMTHNAKVVYWSPNKIVLRRTGPGNIELNMNLAGGWRINNVYPFASIKSINPAIPFIITGSKTKNYTLEYAPKLSPGWLSWRIGKL